jgi:hypothetical protein
MSQPNSGPSMAVTVAFIAIGALIFIPSGLCTGVFMFGPMIESMLYPGIGRENFFPEVLIIGGPFMLIGGTMLWLGIRRVREYMRARKENANRFRDF